MFTCIGFGVQVYMRLHAGLRQPVEGVAVRAVCLAGDAGRAHVQHLAGGAGSREPVLGRVSAARLGTRLDHPAHGRLHLGGGPGRRRLQRAARVRVPHRVGARCPHRDFPRRRPQRHGQPRRPLLPAVFARGAYRNRNCDERKRNRRVDAARGAHGVRQVGVLPVRVQSSVRQHSAGVAAARDARRAERVRHQGSAPDAVLSAQSDAHSASSVRRRPGRRPGGVGGGALASCRRGLVHRKRGQS